MQNSWVFCELMNSRVEVVRIRYDLTLNLEQVTRVVREIFKELST